MSARGVLSLDQEVGVSDAILLDPLSEEAFIANLHQRFKRDQIYTYVGSVVVSVNPYKKLAVYNTEIIHAYQQNGVHELPPHIYGAANCAYEAMKDRNQDQCIMITGESGSGKTEAAKYILHYVAVISGRWKEVTAIKEYLLQSHPVLEAFGHAKTLRNDNSSRFGKYLDIEFDFKGDPIGGVITQYLLEKSRVIQQTQGERNYHIFYQLLTGADVHLLKGLKLQRNCENYAILRHSKCYQADNIDDRSSFLLTKRSMEALGFTQEEMLSAFQVVAAVLKLGNCQFQPCANMDGTEGCTLMNEYEVYDVCDLLHGNFANVHAALTQRIMDSRHETVIADLSASEATYARDALCKALYSRLFTWIVNKINETIRAKRMGKRKLIGILDIYGFEVFEKNTFEQLIINYCNEKLQNVLIEITLKQEQEEYLREGISWLSMEYFNNAVICDLIEKNNHGVLAMLDEECLRCGSVNDESFLFKLTQACQDNPYFESRGCRNFLMDSTLPHQCFRLRHYAGAVTYTVAGFIEKNTDMLYRDLSQAMYNCEHPLMKILFPEGNPKRTTLKRPATIATQFRISIGALTKSLQAKHPNFVRCIKPNEMKQPMKFEMALVQHQVRYLGLLEVTKMKKAGYAFRQDYETFLRRFKMLSVHTWPIWSGLPIEGVTHLLRDLPVHPTEYAFGRTKVFIKHDRTVYELEEFRRERLNELAVLIQKTWRGWIHRQHFVRRRKSQAIISNNFRCWKFCGESRREEEPLTRAARAIFIFFFHKKRRTFLMWLSRHLPDDSPTCSEWPKAPWCLVETSYIIRKLYHKWRCHKYRQKFDQTARNRMREKVTASMIFKDRKTSYPKSVSHPFRGDYLRLRHNVRWKRIATESGDQYVVFADIINKISRSSGKCVQKLFVVSTSSMIVMDQRTLQIKYRIPAPDIIRISLSPFIDDIAVFHVRSTDATKKKGDFLFETCHVIEIVTKLFLVIQNATGKPPDVCITSEFEANFGKENVLVSFKCSGAADVQAGQARISRKTNKLEVVL